MRIAVEAPHARTQKWGPQKVNCYQTARFLWLTQTRAMALRGILTSTTYPLE